MLRKRKLIIGKNKKNFLYFDTHIVDNKYRKLNIDNQKISTYLMTLAKKYIFKKKSLAFLLCQKKLFRYYKQNGWNQISRDKFQINGKKKAEILMQRHLRVQQTEELVLKDKKIAVFIEGKRPKKIIVISGRIVNVVL